MKCWQLPCQMVQVVVAHINQMIIFYSICCKLPCQMVQVVVDHINQMIIFYSICCKLPCQMVQVVVALDVWVWVEVLVAAA